MRRFNSVRSSQFTMKLAVTITDHGAAVNIGGEVERTTVVFEVPDANVPSILKEYFLEKSQCDPTKGRFSCLTASLSFVKADKSLDLTDVTKH